VLLLAQGDRSARSIRNRRIEVSFRLCNDKAYRRALDTLQCPLLRLNDESFEGASIIDVVSPVLHTDQH
jgi:hypothetical protein